MKRNFQVFHLEEVPKVPMQGGRGIQKLMVNGDRGATALELYITGRVKRTKEPAPSKGDD